MTNLPVIPAPTLNSLLPSARTLVAGNAAISAYTLTISPVQPADTFVPIIAMPTGIVSINGGGVTIPAGQTSAIVMLDTLTIGPATLTAQLNQSSATAQVNVISQAVVPGAPTVTNGIAGNAQIKIEVLPPMSDGGSAILGYQLVCDPGTYTASGGGPQLTVMGVTNGTSYSCTAAATNAVGTGAASAAVIVTPTSTPPPVLQAVKSRKFHRNLGNLDVTIDTTKAIGDRITVEPRTGTGIHLLRFEFDRTITIPGAVTAVDANGVSVGAVTIRPGGNTVEVTLSGVPDGKRVRVRLINVEGMGVDADIAVGFLVGDITMSGQVNAADISASKSRQGKPLVPANAIFDIDGDGIIDTRDVSAVKARSGKTMP